MSIDVLIPVYNAQATLEAAVGSIQRQTVSDLRIVCVDDGSTDASGKILRRLEAEDPRITVVTQANAGIVDALNAGLERCRSPLIARHDADDVAYPRRLEIEAAYLRQNPDCLAVSGAARHIGPDGRPLGSFARMRAPDEADARWFPTREPYLMHPFLLVRRDALQAVGGYRHAHHAEDVDLYWRLLERGRLHNLKDVLGDYRLGSTSIMSRSIRDARWSVVASQRTGMAHLRRTSGEGDLDFSRAWMQGLVRQETFEAALAYGERELAAEERVRFRLAASAKLLELTGYRPYELDRADCETVSRAFAEGWRLVRPENRAELYRRRTDAAIRLIKKGAIDRARAIADAWFWPELSKRVALALGRRLTGRQAQVAA